MSLSLATETWLPIAGFDRYFVSDQGRIRSDKHPTPLIMKTGTGSGGYEQVQLCRHNIVSNIRVHKLVADTFLGPRPVGQEVRHLNGNPMDNRLSNLRYGTPSENAYDRVRHATHSHAKKTHCPRGHEYTADNIYRPPSKPNSRECCTCRRAAWARRPKKHIVT